MDNHNTHLAVCIMTVSDPRSSKNPVAWFDLEKAGVTREIMAENLANGTWMGPQPLFEDASDRESEVWKLMVEKAAT